MKSASSAFPATFSDEKLDQSRLVCTVTCRQCGKLYEGDPYQAVLAMDRHRVSFPRHNVGYGMKQRRGKQ